MTFVDTLREFKSYCQAANRNVQSAEIPVTERYARRVLKIRKQSSLEFEGIRLRCVGSRAWRERRSK